MDRLAGRHGAWLEQVVTGAAGVGVGVVGVEAAARAVRRENVERQQRGRHARRRARRVDLDEPRGLDGIRVSERERARARESAAVSSFSLSRDEVRGER